MAEPLKVGDPVCYAASFLRDIGDFSTERASMRGTIHALPHGPHDSLVLVVWDYGGGTRHVHKANLIHADRKHLEPS